MDKIHAPQGVRMILLADLHGISYGKDNIRLTETIRKLAPDVILSAGDMAVRAETNTLVTACVADRACRRFSRVLCTWQS